MKENFFIFNKQQRDIILRMNVTDSIELFEINNENVFQFLYALHKQHRIITVDTTLFQCSHFQGVIHLGVYQNVLSYKLQNRWMPLGTNYRLLGVYLSEHLGKDPFLFLGKPERKKPKITIIDLFFEMGLSEIGQRGVKDILLAEIIPPKKELALRKALKKAQTQKKYTVKEIFTKMPLSRVGDLTVSQFFGAEVFSKK